MEEETINGCWNCDKQTHDLSSDGLCQECQEGVEKSADSIAKQEYWDYITDREPYCIVRARGIEGPGPCGICSRPCLDHAFDHRMN